MVNSKQSKANDISVKKVDKNAIDNISIQHNKYRRIWIDRKRKCIDLVECISDGMGKSTKALMVSILGGYIIKIVARAVVYTCIHIEIII